MVPLISYIEQHFPFWRFLNRREKMHALHGILPTINIAVEGAQGSSSYSSNPPLLLDTHVSMDSHYTRIRTQKGVDTVFNHACNRLGYDPDVDLPLVRSRGGSLHVLESLIVL